MPVFVSEALIIGFAPTSLGVEQRLAGRDRGKRRQRAIHVGNHGVDIFRGWARNGSAAGAGARTDITVEADDVGKRSSRVSVHLGLKVRRQTVCNRGKAWVRPDRRWADNLRGGVEFRPTGENTVCIALQTGRRTLHDATRILLHAHQLLRRTNPEYGSVPLIPNLVIRDAGAPGSLGSLAMLRHRRDPGDPDRIRTRAIRVEIYGRMTLPRPVAAAINATAVSRTRGSPSRRAGEVVEHVRAVGVCIGEPCVHEGPVVCSTGRLDLWPGNAGIPQALAAKRKRGPGRIGAVEVHAEVKITYLRIQPRAAGGATCVRCGERAWRSIVTPTAAAPTAAASSADWRCASAAP